MKAPIAAILVVTSTMLAPLVVHAADAGSDRNHPMVFVKDSVITTKIKTKLAAEKISSLGRVKVETDSKGAVVLSGNVGSVEEADRAIYLARDTEGVTSVITHLKIKKAD